jgi:hypothetical protein
MLQLLLEGREGRAEGVIRCRSDSASFEQRIFARDNILLSRLASSDIKEKYQSHVQGPQFDYSLCSFAVLSLLLTLDAILEFVTRYGFESDPSVRINIQKTSNNGCKLKKLPYPESQRPSRSSMLSG